MRITSIIFVLTLYFMASCKSNNSYVQQGKEIPEIERQQIANIGNRVCNDLKMKSASYLRSIASQVIPASQLNVLDSISRYSTVNPNSGSSTILRDFYIKNDGATLINTVTSHDLAINDFTFSFKPHGPETYIHLFVVPGFNNERVLVSSIFNKEGGQWKLTGIFADRYTYDLKTAPQLFLLSKEQYKCNDFFKSLLSLQKAQVISSLAGDSFHYLVESEVTEFFKTLINHLKQTNVFPIKIFNRPGSPEILALKSEVVQNEICTYVIYRTSVSLNDSVSIQKEAQLVKQNIENIFKGITEANSCLVFRATNDSPQSGRAMQFFDFR